ncbi:MAG: hypothetical protein DBX55_05350 [Verrucomicrobia bacterium]|nr:MAG: hypothetical protein DBX55_05350 [Verrucomicrobiota bacterium]
MRLRRRRPNGSESAAKFWAHIANSKTNLQKRSIEKMERFLLKNMRAAKFQQAGRRKFFHSIYSHSIFFPIPFSREMLFLHSAKLRNMEFHANTKFYAERTPRCANCGKRHRKRRMRCNCESAKARIQRNSQGILSRDGIRNFSLQNSQRGGI